MGTKLGTELIEKTAADLAREVGIPASALCNVLDKMNLDKPGRYWRFAEGTREIMIARKAAEELASSLAQARKTKKRKDRARGQANLKAATSARSSTSTVTGGYVSSPVGEDLRAAEIEVTRKKIEAAIFVMEHGINMALQAMTDCGYLPVNWAKAESPKFELRYTTTRKLFRKVLEVALMAKLVREGSVNAEDVVSESLTLAGNIAHLYERGRDVGLKEALKDVA